VKGARYNVILTSEKEEEEEKQVPFGHRLRVLLTERDD